MQTRMKFVGLVAVFTLGGLLVAACAARAAGCCGGGSASRAGGYGGGYSYAGSAYAGSGVGSYCAMPSMNMQGLPMGATPAPALAAPAPAVAASYTCPMHPIVVSATPATCPYCHMALVRR